MICETGAFYLNEQRRKTKNKKQFCNFHLFGTKFHFPHKYLRYFRKAIYSDTHSSMFLECKKKTERKNIWAHIDITQQHKIISSMCEHLYVYTHWTQNVSLHEL